jgi:hypothetical protein
MFDHRGMSRGYKIKVDGLIIMHRVSGSFKLKGQPTTPG